MKITPYGVRGSLAAPGPATARYGGNTSCVRVTGPDGAVLVLEQPLKFEARTSAVESPGARSLHEPRSSWT